MGPRRLQTASVPCLSREPNLKILLDLLPVVVFFVAFRLAKAAPQLAHAWAAAVLGSVPAAASAASDIVPVIVATACAIVATLIQVSWLLLRRATVTASVWLSAALIVVFGGLTVWLHNEWFIKWKPTLLYWAFAAVLACMNLVVAYQFSTEAWVNFKTFGLLGLTFAYSVSTGIYVARHLKAPSNG